MGSTYNDGSLNYGSDQLTLTPAGGGTPLAYVMENINFTPKVSRIEQFDEKGEPLRAAGVPKFGEGSCTAQIATTTTRIIKSGDTFQYTFDPSVGAQNFLVHEAGQVLGQNDPRKQNVTFYIKKN